MRYTRENLLSCLRTQLGVAMVEKSGQAIPELCKSAAVDIFVREGDKDDGVTTSIVRRALKDLSSDGCLDFESDRDPA